MHFPKNYFFNQDVPVSLGERKKTALQNLFAASFVQKQASWCPVKGIFSRWYLTNSCPLFETHVTSSALTLRPNITDQTAMFGVSRGETTSLLMGGGGVWVGGWGGADLLRVCLARKPNTCTVHTAALFCTCKVRTRVLVRSCTRAAESNGLF